VVAAGIAAAFAASIALSFSSAAATRVFIWSAFVLSEFKLVKAFFRLLSEGGAGVYAAAALGCVGAGADVAGVFEKELPIF
jgi:hypothetical protein